MTLTLETYQNILNNQYKIDRKELDILKLNYPIFNALGFAIKFRLDKYNDRKIKEINYGMNRIASTDIKKILTVAEKGTDYNYGLLVEKFPYFNTDKFDYIKNTRKGDELNYSFSATDHSAILAFANEKQAATVKKLKAQKKKIISLFLEQNYRMVLNIGEENGYNNGFLFHHLYGIPYLNESAQKGIFRTYIVEKYFKDDEDAALNDSVFQFLFGKKNNNEKDIALQGNLRFLNAFPTNENFKIEADIMNNHNTDYYGKGYAVSDKDKKTPIKFITLKNAKFKPVIYLDNLHLFQLDDSECPYAGKIKNTDIQTFIEEEYYEAYRYKGIGAKTNVGYGRLKINEEGKEAHKKEMEKAEELNESINSLLEKCENFNDIQTKIGNRIKQRNTKLDQNELNKLLERLGEILKGIKLKNKQKFIDRFFKENRITVIKSLVRQEDQEKIIDWYNLKR